MNTLLQKIVCFIATCALQVCAHAAITLEPKVGSQWFRGNGFSIMNSRLSESSTLKVTQTHDSAYGWGLAARYSNKEFNSTFGISYFGISDLIEIKGLGTSVSSKVSITQALLDYQWRLFPARPMQISGQTQSGIGNRIFVFVGPIAGITSVKHSYKLLSSLENKQVEYEAQSLHLTTGAELSSGFTVLKRLHILLSGKIFFGKPITTESGVSNFAIDNQDLRFRAADLEVGKLTGSNITSWLCTAGVQVVL